MTQPMFTPGPWDWVIHDYSMATLGVLPDPGLGDPMVLCTSPCDACASRADPKEWKWGRCHTPSEADARLIAAAPNLYAALAEMVDRWEPDCTGKDRVMWENARAALAKAESRP